MSGYPISVVVTPSDMDAIVQSPVPPAGVKPSKRDPSAAAKPVAVVAGGVTTTASGEQCVAPDMPFRGTGAVSASVAKAHVVETPVGKVTVTFPSLVACQRSLVVVQPENLDVLAKVLSGEADGNSVGVTVTLLMWTAKGKTGKPCVAPDDCVRLSRKLTLTLNEAGNGLIGGVTPDPSVQHYQFIVSVTALIRSSSRCYPEC